MMKYQNYKHYKLPITLNPLNYGKLIVQIGKHFIIQINRTNIVLITQFEDINHVKLFKEGDYIFEYKDHKSNNSTFIRSLNNNKFTFKDSKLLSKETLVLNSSFISLKFSLIFLLFIILFVIFPESNDNTAIAILSGKNKLN